MFGLMGVARMSGQPGGAFSPLSLFANGEQGGDFSRIGLTNTFSDTAGTTAATVNGSVASVRSAAGTVAIVTQATGANQPKLRGTPTGANLAAADANFFTPGNWTQGTGWVIGDAVAVATTATSSLSLAGLPAVNAKIYLLRYYVTRTAGSVAVNFGGVAGVSRSATGIYEEYITATGTGALSFDGTGFTGTVSEIQIYDATTVGAPYWLEMDGTNDCLSAAYTQSAYPLTLVARVRVAAESSGVGASVSVNEPGFYDLKANVAEGWALDWKEGPISAYGGGAYAATTQVNACEFTGSFLTMRQDMLAGTPAANTNTFGAKSTLTIGGAPDVGFYLHGRLYGALVINRTLTVTEVDDLEQYLGADNAIQAWGDSMTAGSGIDVFSPWPLRLRRAIGRQVENKGAGGQTSTQIAARFAADATNKDKWINTFWMGTNDAPAVDGWGPTKANIAACIAGLKGRARYLVLGVTKGEGGPPGSLFDSLDADLLALYGSRFVDVRAYLMARGDGSANDLADIADGLVPRSLRSDTIHLNDTGYQHVTELLHSRLAELGWLE